MDSWSSLCGQHPPGPLHIAPVEPGASKTNGDRHKVHASYCAMSNRVSFSEPRALCANAHWTVTDQLVNIIGQNHRPFAVPESVY